MQSVAAGTAQASHRRGDPIEGDRTIRLAMTATIATLLLATAAHAQVPYRADGDIQKARKEIRRLWGASAPRMMCIIGRESGWNPRAVSRTGDHGLAQLNAYTWRRYFGRRWQRVYDPVENVRMAYAVWKRQGWAAWHGGRWAC